MTRAIHRAKRVPLRAASPAAQVASRLEALLSVALTGLLGFVVGNRIRHS